MSEKKFVEMEVDVEAEFDAMDYAKKGDFRGMTFTILNSLVDSIVKSPSCPINVDDVEIVFKAGTWRLRIPLKEAEGG